MKHFRIILKKTDIDLVKGCIEGDFCRQNDKDNVCLGIEWCGGEEDTAGCIGYDKCTTRDNSGCDGEDHCGIDANGCTGHDSCTIDYDNCSVSDSCSVDYNTCGTNDQCGTLDTDHDGCFMDLCLNGKDQEGCPDVNGDGLMTPDCGRYG